MNDGRNIQSLLYVIYMFVSVSLSNITKKEVWSSFQDPKPVMFFQNPPKRGHEPCKPWHNEVWPSDLLLKGSCLSFLRLNKWSPKNLPRWCSTKKSSKIHQKPLKELWLKERCHFFLKNLLDETQLLAGMVEVWGLPTRRWGLWMASSIDTWPVSLQS